MVGKLVFFWDGLVSWGVLFLPQSWFSEIMGASPIAVSFDFGEFFVHFYDTMIMGDSG